MKIAIKFLAISLIFAASFSGCKEDDSSAPAPTSSPSISAVGTGSWKITLFTDNGTDETNHFFGYSFRFNIGGTAVATNSSGSVNGTWSLRQDNSRIKFTLNFAPSPLNELNEDWHVVMQSSTILHLEHVSGGNGGTQFLNLKKI